MPLFYIIDDTEDKISFPSVAEAEKQIEKYGLRNKKYRIVKEIVSYYLHNNKLEETI